MPDETATTALAHIVYPGQRLCDVWSGKKTKAKALCGVFVKGRAGVADDICRVCFDEYEANGFHDGENGE